MAIEIGRLRISGAALLALMAVYFFDSGEFLLLLGASIAVHELGHMAALRLYGCRAAEIRLELWGVSLRPDARLSYGREIVAAAAGPLSSLLAAALTAWAGHAFQAPGLYLAAGVNLTLCVFNILPVYPLDGGRLVYSAACIVFGPETADRIVCVTSCAVILSLLAGGAALLIATRVNFTLLLAAAWLLIGYCQRSGIRIKSKRKNSGCEAWTKN